MPAGYTRSIILFLLFIFFACGLSGQMITGTWKGKIGKQKAEVKIVQRGDSLTGTSYYYESETHFRRYSIKGYFDQNTNEVVWWDDLLIEERSGKINLLSPGRIPLLSTADFNCPGGGKMMLDGKAAEKDDLRNPKGEVHLDKTEKGNFEDEWDFVIDNYTEGTNDPFIIDSVEAIAETSMVKDIEKPLQEEKVFSRPVVKEETAQKKQKTIQPDPVLKKEEIKAVPLSTPSAIEQKFVARKKVFIKEIPLTGDSIELRFYDNAEIDGDSISLFLNDKLMFEHIRLTAVAYTLKLSVKDLKESNELIMVAENLGSIPPNTAYMVAIVNDERYDARLASSEGSSAMVRFVKPPH
jgi:hypothetical protein